MYYREQVGTDEGHQNIVSKILISQSTRYS